MQFHSPLWLLGLLVLPALGWAYWSQRRREAVRLRFPDLGLLPGAGAPLRVRARRALPMLRLGGAALLLVALARPQSVTTEEQPQRKGIDIILVLDSSQSMLAEDFPPNRFEAARGVLKRFIAGIKSDRLGLVVFAAEAFTQCPLTLDHEVLLDLLDQVQIGVVKDGTAIGMAIATAAARLDQSQAKSKVIILLTDGINNTGRIDPKTAAHGAAALGIRIYPIGVGSAEKGRPVPVLGRMMELPMDEAALQELARITGGKYFPAGDEAALQQVYDSIWKLETSAFEAPLQTRRSELFGWLLWPGLVLVGLETVLGCTALRKAP